MNHQDAIIRLEAATGPDREIDYAIAEMLCPFLAEHGYRRIAGDRGWRSDTPHISGAHVIAPASAYTGSVDAALTLIPEGLFYLFGIGRVRSGEPIAAAQIMRPVSLEKVAEAEADTLPIAVCVAALKARAV